MSQNISSSCFTRSVFAIFLSILLTTSSFSQTPAPAADAGNATASAGAASAAPAGGGADPMVDKGKSVFKSAGCSACHALHKKVTGPALEGAFDRWGKNEAKMINFIKSPAKAIAAGEPRATAVYADFKSAGIMPNHDFLSDDDIKAVIAYIKAAPPEEGPKTEKVVGTDTQPAQQNDNSTFILILVVIVLVLVLLALVLVLVFVRRYLKDRETTLRDDEKYLLDQRFEMGTFLKSKGFIGVAVFLFVCVGARSCYMGLLAVGVEQNYEPKQPIPFSHKIHAGQYKIDCNYCHTGVMKSKQANIPSINICMNCHSQIQEGAQFGKAAIGVLLDYNEKKRPIEWVRVHNLPDLAYFNHSQHVNAGGVECQTCHGPIDSMDVVRQYSPLTMGWCINCHRETNVKLENPYYQGVSKFKAIYEKHENMKVEDIGGLECARCHY